MFNSGHVHIRQFSQDYVVLDAAEPKHIQQQWATYGKLVSEMFPNSRDAH